MYIYVYICLTVWTASVVGTFPLPTNNFQNSLSLSLSLIFFFFLSFFLLSFFSVSDINSIEEGFKDEHGDEGTNDGSAAHNNSSSSGNDVKCSSDDVNAGDDVCF